MNELTEIVNKYGGMKQHIGNHRGGINTANDADFAGYTEEYVKFFDEIKNNEINFLEIGIFQGHSLAMWSDYFSNGKIYGIDKYIIDFEMMKNELMKMGAFSNQNLCDTLEGDSTDLSTFSDEAIDIHLQMRGEEAQAQYHNHYLRQQKLKSLPNFDVIIDDGDHSPLAQLETFKNFYPLLNSKGFYIIEDITLFEWQDERGKDLKSDIMHLRHPVYSHLSSRFEDMDSVNMIHCINCGMMYVRKK